jgi:hypothetical protein
VKTSLASYVAASPRFSRSANVERDHGLRAIEGYVPTGRAVDVIARVAEGLTDPAAGRAFSLTGPHGGGKSSFAVYLDALLSAASAPEHKSAHQVLRSVDAHAQRRLAEGVRSLGASRSGFVRAFATAEVESVAKTIGRAIHTAVVRDYGTNQDLAPDSFMGSGHTPTNAEIVACVRRICEQRPLVLVIDEFGKNLEYFASAADSGDPYLLQQLAETTQGEAALPLLLVTMQHLSFEEYLQRDASALRREWSKVQGRFQDIPFVESPAEARRLIAASLRSRSPDFEKAASEWLQKERKALESLGLHELLDYAKQALPLHPLTLMVLPDLCSRYGQNERTLFSFLAGAEPNAVPAFLKRANWSPGAEMPLIGLDRLYDYFLESSASMIGVADSASRWIEVETRIRDAAGLSTTELLVMKAVGVLNLVATGGRARASSAMLQFALSYESRTTPAHVAEALVALTDSGRLVYRSFSDEYRVWQGSDYDLKRVIDTARRDCEQTDLADLLNTVTPLDPIVAGRHSQRTGVLRVFEQRFGRAPKEVGSDPDATFDGTVIYATDTEFDPDQAKLSIDCAPVVIVIPEDLSAIKAAAIEAGALMAALRIAENEKADWVARHELVERAAAAQQILGSVVGQTWGAEARWILAGVNAMLGHPRGPSAVLSEVSDLVYKKTPRIRNEMIARRELTSQGAKARRELIEAMLRSPDAESLGISGYGPERAMYEAVLRATGIHRADETGAYGLHPPIDRTWLAVWQEISNSMDSAVDSRSSLNDIGSRMALPPFGLKSGIVPLLLLAVLLARQDEIAIYEHGSLVLALDDAVAERLVKNPGHFSIRNTQAQTERRRAVLQALVARFKISSGSDDPTFLKVATALFRELRVLPPFVQKAKRSLSAEAAAVRDAFHSAAEPDVLIFETLPTALGFPSFGGSGPANGAEAEAYATRLVEIFLELRGSYPALLDDIGRRLARATSIGGELSAVKEQLAAQAKSLEGRVLEPRLRSFVAALTRSADDQTWLENVAMVIADGQAPRVWNDDIAGHFPLKVAELGGALRRTLALLYERLASGSDEGFEVSRMTVTRPDGSESVELLAITEQERATVDEYLSPSLDRLVQQVGSWPAARRMLMARLIADFEKNESVEIAPDLMSGRESG